MGPTGQSEMRTCLRYGPADHRCRSSSRGPGEDPSIAVPGTPYRRTPAALAADGPLLTVNSSIRPAFPALPIAQKSANAYSIFT